MHGNKANAAEVMKFVGHDDGSATAVHWGYVRDLPDLKPIVDELKWPIDLQALRYDGRFASFLANRKNWALDKSTAKATAINSKSKKGKPAV